MIGKGPQSKSSTNAKPVSDTNEFTNENKVKVTLDKGVKTWKCESSMVQLVSKTVISSGTHRLTLKSINDPGGYTVIGITDGE